MARFLHKVCVLLIILSTNEVLIATTSPGALALKATRAPTARNPPCDGKAQPTSLCALGFVRPRGLLKTQNLHEDQDQVAQQNI